MKKLIGLGVVLMLLIPSVGWSKIGGGDVTFRSPGAEAVVFSHDFHIGKGLKCNDCHYKLFGTAGHMKRSTMDDMAKGRSCGACHNGQTAFAPKGKCAKCHK